MLGLFEQKGRRVLWICIIVCTFLLGSVFGAGADSHFEKISAYLDKSIKLQAFGDDFVPKNTSGHSLTPINYNGSTYLPLRAVAEAVLVPLQWDEATRTVSLGYETIQLHNYTQTSSTDIQISGSWRPSYLTPAQKTYSNSFMGVTFETHNLDGNTLSNIVDVEKRYLEQVHELLDVSPIEAGGLKGELLEYRTFSGGDPDAHIKSAYLASNNSYEYYTIKFFIRQEKFDEYKHVFDDIIASFRKQL